MLCVGGLLMMPLRSVWLAGVLGAGVVVAKLVVVERLKLSGAKVTRRTRPSSGGASAAARCSAALRRVVMAADV